MKTYMVWAFIEECDEENDEYQDVSTPKLLKAFDNETEARKYVNKLAAAPDLLEACKMALRYAQSAILMQDDPDFNEDLAFFDYYEIEAAIKKAGAE